MAPDNPRVKDDRGRRRIFNGESHRGRGLFMLVTLSGIKADVGSIGGHTRPTERMLAEVNRRVSAACGDLLIDGMVTDTGDDIALLMSQTHGTGDMTVNKFGWDLF